MAEFIVLDPFFNKQHFRILFQTFFNSFLFFFLLPVPLAHKLNEKYFPHTCFLPFINQKEFNCSHALLCFKNKGMDGPNLG